MMKLVFKPNRTMNGDQEVDNQLEAQMQRLSDDTWALAKRCQGERELLLFMLRTLERLHRQIREELFQPSLPNTRNALYELVKNIEESGGWPYIERMKLRDLLVQLQDDLTDSRDGDSRTEGK